jgi:hypothetical protein
MCLGDDQPSGLPGVVPLGVVYLEEVPSIGGIAFDLGLAARPVAVCSAPRCTIGVSRCSATARCESWRESLANVAPG